MILGVVLGPILDANLRRSLVLTDGDLGPFFMRPISAVLWITILTLIIVSLPPVQRWFARLRGPRPSDAAPDPGTASPRTASRETPRG
jgi:putative tricarboxylic transport membrane protein